MSKRAFAFVVQLLHPAQSHLHFRTRFEKTQKYYVHNCSVMVHIFLSGAGGVGKTTLAGELRVPIQLIK